MTPWGGQKIGHSFHLPPLPIPPCQYPPISAHAARSRRTVGAGMPGEVGVAPSPVVMDDLTRISLGYESSTRADVEDGPSP